MVAADICVHNIKKCIYQFELKSIKNFKAWQPSVSVARSPRFFTEPGMF